MLENLSVSLFFYQELRRKALTRMFYENGFFFRQGHYRMRHLAHGTNTDAGKGVSGYRTCFFVTPGLHADIHELERQLVERINKARELTNKIIVVYGGKFCYVNAEEPLRKIQTIIEEQGPGSESQND